MRMGFVDIAERDRVAGWAADPEAPDDVIEVAIVVNGREAGRVKADRLRLDLQRSGKFGRGRHGFEFNFDPPLDPAFDHQVLVLVAGEQSLLPRGAFTFRRHSQAAAFMQLPAGRDRPHAPASSPRPRYVIHVGPPKTGTKYLQHNFWRLRHQLRAQGVYYPTEWWQDGPLFAHHQLAEALRNGPDAQTAEILSQLNACGLPTVLLSSEGFTLIPEAGLQRFRDMTQGATVEIVLYARRWSDWIPSQWQQAVKQGSLQTFPEWYASLLANANTHLGINQHVFIERFARIFGRQNIKLVSYSNLTDHGVDIFDHFCGKILNLPPSPSVRGDGALIHESMGALLTEMIRCLNARNAMRAGEPGYHVFEAYQETSTDPALAADVALLYSAMRRHVGETTLDDNLFFLQPVYDSLNEYRDLLVSPEYGAGVFEKKRGQCRFVRSDYLMEDGVPSALGRISEALRRHRETRAAAPAAQDALTGAAPVA